ncbi:MAG: SDR family oxidoreductase [Desulfovibrionaceae bacterium]
MEPLSPDAIRGGTVCVLGATGYVGGRLVPLLLERGHRVRAVGRSLEKLAARPWAGHERCELAEADVMDPASLRNALRGCMAAYYLVHSMHPESTDYDSDDQRAARNMAQAAQEAGLGRIIYLGGLTPQDPHLSRHLRSRAEVGRILASGPVPCTVLQAAIILGSGSASFELIRYITDRLPVMITPLWVRTEVQPISIRDVLAYLTGCLDHPETTGRTFDIGGPYIETYETMFRIYAEEAGLPRRLILPVPLLSPWLSSHWLGLVSPIPTPLARPLVLGLRNRVVCSEHAIREIIPLELTDARTAIRRALDKVAWQSVDTCWSDAGLLRHPEWAAQGDAPYAGGTVYGDAYRIRLAGCVEEMWAHVAAIGGEHGWYAGGLLWSLRGFMDKLVGGVGLRRGRRADSRLKVGDAIDFWRVLDVCPPHRLLLMAEMKVPGEALLEFRLEPYAGEGCDMTMTAKFLPRGVAGLLYWWAVYPFHSFVFKGMAREMAAHTRCSVVEGPVRAPVNPRYCRLPTSSCHDEDDALGV